MHDAEVRDRTGVGCGGECRLQRFDIGARRWLPTAGALVVTTMFVSDLPIYRPDGRRRQSHDSHWRKSAGMKRVAERRHNGAMQFETGGFDVKLVRHGCLHPSLIRKQGVAWTAFDAMRGLAIDGSDDNR
ncbi:MAG: hypothetical protein J0G37_06465 [Afipia sp.]|nr:hypothetical protein [Afipia sp.]